MFPGGPTHKDTKIMRIGMNSRQRNLITVEEDGADVQVEVEGRGRVVLFLA